MKKVLRMQTLLNILATTPLVLLGFFFLCALIGTVPASVRPAIRPVSAELTVGHDSATLFVVVHGLSGAGKMQGLRSALNPFGDVLLIDFPAWSNANPEQLSAQISEKIQAVVERKSYEKIVIVGYSMGALFARRAFLVASAAKKSWAGKVSRLVLLAGMNRGWSFSGPRPSDMRWHTYAVHASGAWFSNLTRSATLIMATQTGAPFVANLRLDWIRWFRDETKPRPEVVQLLGDIDEIVTKEDNEDIAAAPEGRFAWLKVRGSGHGDVRDFDDASDNHIGRYRRDKFLLAATSSFDKVLAQSELMPAPKDEAATKLVFILHGIRDLGRWSSTLEHALRVRHAEARDGKSKLVIESVRYGYFGMGQFLLKIERDEYVRWFMDEYTEAVAKYPNATEIDFIGHSNGTFLFTRALEQYGSFQVHRVVLAGSVARCDYDWNRYLDNGQVHKVRNYVAKDDIVVALLPRVFENKPEFIFGNQVGSAGFNGFLAADTTTGKGRIENYRFLTGGHGAFTEESTAISAFIIPTANAEVAAMSEPRVTNWLTVASDYFTAVLWAVGALVLVWLGLRLMDAAGSHALLALLAYAATLWQVLRWA